MFRKIEFKRLKNILHIKKFAIFTEIKEIALNDILLRFYCYNCIFAFLSIFWDILFESLMLLTMICLYSRMYYVLRSVTKYMKDLATSFLIMALLINFFSNMAPKIPFWWVNGSFGDNSVFVLIVAHNMYIVNSEIEFSQFLLILTFCQLKMAENVQKTSFFDILS